MLASLSDQTSADWRLLARDDSSTDATLSVLEGFSARIPNNVTVLNADGQQLGSCASFSKLLDQAKSPYIMLCDQDDVWLPDKIEKTMAAMQAAEKQYGSTTPLLVHTDLKVVDENLQPIAESFWNYQNLSPALGSRLNRLLAQNVVAGCTVMINRALADLAIPIPSGAAMHDWWLALVAATFGKVVYLEEPTILYRQHGENAVGAKRWGVERILYKIQNSEEVRQSIVTTTCQAQALLDCYHNKMTFEQCRMVVAYADLPYMAKYQRIITAMRYGFFKHGLIRSLGFLVHLFLLGRAKRT